MKGHLYDPILEIQKAVLRELKKIPEGALMSAMENLVECSKRCVDSEGMYIEL